MKKLGFNGIFMFLSALFGTCSPESCYSCDVINYVNGSTTGDSTCEQPDELTPTVNCANYCSSSRQQTTFGTHLTRGCANQCGLQRLNWTVLNETQLSFLARTGCCNGDNCNTARGRYQLDDTAAAETNRCFSCSYASVRYGDKLLQYGDQSCVTGQGIPYIDCPQNLCIVSTAYRSTQTWDIQYIDRFCSESKQLPVILIQNGVNTIFIAQQGVFCTSDLCNGPELQFSIPTFSPSTNIMGGQSAEQANGSQTNIQHNIVIVMIHMLVAVVIKPLVIM